MPETFKVKVFESKENMSDDEEDYMSEAFLAKCVPEDVRPGLKRVSQNLFPNFYFQETFFQKTVFFRFCRFNAN